jgi:Mg-chelatase subunit ChlD
MRPARLLIAALALACRRDAGPSPVAVDATADLAPTPLPAGRASAGGLCRGVDLLGFERHAADVLIVFDRSSSMTIELGAGTRYSVAAGLLSDLVTAYGDKLRFGYQEFPARTACDGHAPGCCTQRPSLPVGQAQGDAIADALAGAAPPSGASPLAEALRQARLYFAGMEDGVPQRWVLLASDGRPSCALDGHPAGDVFDANGVRVAGPCRDALAETAALAAAGVGLMVVATVPDPAGGGAQGCLDELAQAAATGPAARPVLYSAADPDALETALQRLFGGAERPRCQIDLDSAPPDPDKVTVFVDGRQIPRHPTLGWSYAASDPRHIVVAGEYCRRVQRFQVARIEVRGCPCTDPLTCE